MKQIRFPALVLFLMASAIWLLACAAPAAPAVTATQAPTVVPPTTAPAPAPTIVPPTTAATATSAPTTATGGTADEVVADAFKKFGESDTFHLQANTELSPVFFQGQYTPLPGDDPDLINLFAIDGEQTGADLHYVLKGFLASFIGIFSGFDPDSNEIEILNVDGAQYMRGVLEGETTARWYKIPEDQLASSNFAPQEMVLPMTAPTYPEGSFTKSGTESIGGQTCDVYTGNREAFDAVFPALVSAALLNEETLDLESMDRTEYSLTVCPDGNLYGIKYNFDAHSKTNADDTGTFAFEAAFTEFDGDFSIVPPADAVTLPAEATSEPTIEPDATPNITANFTTLDGEWEGTSGEDSPLSFTVADGVVTYININYSVGSGGCSASGVMANSVENGEIEDSKFSVTLTDSDDVEYTLAGEFESNNQAAGTLSIKGTTFCGETDEQFDWTAQHISSPQVDETPEATQEPTLESTAEPTATATTAPTRTATRQPTRVPPTQTPVPPAAAPAAPAVDGTKIIADAFTAFAAKDLNTALANVSDNVAFNIGGTTGVGKAALQSNVQLALTFGANFSVSDIRQVGDVVNFTTTVTGIRAGTYPNSSAVIQDGKIVVFNIN